MKGFEYLFDCSSRKNFKTEEEDEIEVKSKKRLEPKILIIKLADLHDSLLDSVVKVNSYFSFQVIAFPVVYKV